MPFKFSSRLLVVFILTVIPAITSRGDLSGPEATIRRAMRMRDYSQAVSLIDAALPNAVPEQREFLTYCRGLAKFYMGDHAAAIEEFESQLAAFPEGRWAIKARMRIADAHVAQKEYAKAEAIYAERVRELTGTARKTKLAEVYLGFADEYFKPTDSLSKPNYAQAARFYELAQGLEPGEPLAESLAYKIGLCQLKAEDWSAAQGSFDQYLKRYDAAYRSQLLRTNAAEPLPKPAAIPGEHLTDARLGLGEALLRTGDAVGARRVLTDLLATLSAKELKRPPSWWPRAMHLLAQTHSMPAPPDAASLTAGVKVLEELIALAPDSKEAIQAAHDIGAAYAHLGRGDEAIAAFRTLIDRLETQPADEEARELAAKLSQDALYRIGVVLAAQTKYADAIGVWNEYVAKHPSGAHWSDAQRAIVDAEFDIGTHARKEERFDDARTAWSVFLQKYPLDDRVRGILFEFGQMSFEEQKKREKKGDEPNWQAPIAEWRKLVNKFKGTEEAGRAQFRIAQTLEEKVGELEEAIKAYKALDWSSFASRAQARLTEMKSVRLDVDTERVYRTNEPAIVSVDARNIDTLTVKLYRIDMEDYFRKRHMLRNVDDLDLLLIDPDKQFEARVEKYARYRPITQTIDIPIDGPGVFAVNVSNESSKLVDDDGNALRKLEATTLVIRSDIDILQRSTREQMLVFAQNMLTGEAAPGVRLLVSNGEKTILEAETGADGVWLSSDKQIKESSSATVLALAGGHVAGSGLSLEGLAFAGGLKPRGYITTDRTAYQPGDGVNIRGVLRETANGQYALPTQPEDERQRWKLDIIDAKGRVLSTEEIAATEFGTFATAFQVAKDGPVGEYKIVARRPEGPTFTGTFLVQTYELPKAFLSFDIPERVILRGQPIKGAIVAKFNYGEPVRERMIEYYLQYPTGEMLNRAGVTDEKGRVEFEFDSKSLPEEGGLFLYARQADMSIEAGDQVFVAVRAFTATIETSRPVFLSDEPVEVTVKTLDLKGKPIEQAMTVTALRRTRSRGEWAETKAATAELTTDSQTGRGRATLTLAKGGDYVLRAEGLDKNGRTVTAETRIEVSGADDRTRLRLFSEKQHYKVGDTIALDIHSRIEAGKNGPATEQPPLAMIVFEGDGILSYRTARLEPGHNAVAIPVEHAHFPNFSVAVDAMTTRKLYCASRDFTVERQLHIAIVPEKETFRPREEMSVALSVTDHRGQPVSAEVELAMIDNAVLARFPDQTPSITQFFQEGAHRVTSGRSHSSCTFRYNATTRPMVTDVLDEETRLAERVRRGGEISQLRASLDFAPAPTAARPSEMAEAEEISGQQWQGFDGDPGKMDEKKREPARRAQMARKLGRGLTNAGAEIRDASGGVGGGRFIEGADRLLFQYTNPDGVVDAIGSTFDKMPAQPANEWAVVNQRLITHNKLAYAQFKVPPVVENDARIAAIVTDLPPRSYFPEVAYWNPRITTDADGKATVTIIVPDSSTSWRLQARGVTTETICGQATVDVTSKHDFFVEMLVPDALVEGDTFQPTVQVHCLADYTGDIAVDFEWQFGEEGTAQTAKQIITVKGSGVTPVTFPAIAVAGTDLRLTCSATTAAAPKDADAPLQDIARREMYVEPWGMRVESHAAGSGNDDQVVEIALAADANHDRQMTIAIGSDVRQWIVDEALWSGPRWHGIERQYQAHRIAPPRTHADAASSLIGALYTAGYVRGRLTPGDAGMELLQLEERINGLVAQLLAAQNEDGGWAWSGESRESDPWTTAYVAWGLGKAQRDNFSVAEEARRKLTAYLKQRFAEAQPAQTELKAIVLHGLSWVDEADFGHANRLFRNRQSIGSAGLGYLALTFLQIDRKSMALEVIEAMNQRAREETRGAIACRIISTTDNSAWMQSELETTALALLALLQADPNADTVPSLVAYLTGSARAEGWRPHKARGAVLAALSTYYARGERERSDFTLSVAVNGQTLRKIVSEKESGTTYIAVPPGALVDGAQRVSFDYDGRGEFTYAVSFSGFTTHFPNPRSIRQPAGWAHGRKIRPAPPEYEGRPIQPGWSVAREWGRNGYFRNEARHVPVGKTVDVNIDLSRNEHSRTEAGDTDYLIVQERIPSGFRLLKETLSGNHLAYDLRDNMLTLYYGSLWNLGTLSYTLVATTPGDYRLMPTHLRSVYHSERFHVNESDRVVTVLPRGAENPDSYRLSPDELYHLGRLSFDDGNFEAAMVRLRRLCDEDWVVRDEYYKEVVRMLLVCALERDDNEAVVDNFEILKERFPELVVPFDQIVRVGEAYSKTGQHERAYLVYRATADGSFSRDARIGGVLKSEGRFLDSIDFLETLWLAYPDTPQVANVYFALSQSLYAQADDASSVRARRGSDDRSTRVLLIGEAIGILNDYLTLYPESPVADEASYSLANAWLELDDDQRVIGLTDDFIEAYPASKWVDRFRYMQALAWFRRGEFDRALTLALQVADSTWRDEQGVERPSPNKWLALYIAGQIYHAQLQIAKAIEYYNEVKTQFSDAAEAVRLFEQRYIRLPEVTIFHPAPGGYYESSEWEKALKIHGAAGASSNATLHTAPFVRLDYRNVDNVVVQVYRVDLMKLALAEKNLNNIAGVNLAGVRPLVEKATKLEADRRFVDQAVSIPLELSAVASSDDRAAEGAYLVICRGDDRVASGLVLVTPLALEVTEDADAGRARVSVVNALTRSGARDVHVKVIGSAMAHFRTGETDLRGVYIADDVDGGATAIARDPDGHFAFYRNPATTMLASAARSPRQQHAKQIEVQLGQQVDYYSNIAVDNEAIQSSNQFKLQQLFEQKQEGVQVQAAQ